VKLYMTFLVARSQVTHASRQICQTASYVTNASQTAFIFTQLPILTTYNILSQSLQKAQNASRIIQYIFTEHNRPHSTFPEDSAGSGYQKILIAFVNLLHPRTTKLNTLHILQCISHLVQPIILGFSQFTLSSIPQHRKEIPSKIWGTGMYIRIQY